jgi:TetR/AcrR family transcriptional regulator, mexCD-oprJ operon repressor
MTEPTVDHRRATAERNAVAILDAAERLLARGTSLTMLGIAAEAGVSRPTLYAHHATIGEVVEAVTARAVTASLSAIEAAEPGRGPAGEALERVAGASWSQLAHFDAIASGAAEHVSAAALHRAHAPLMRPLQQLVERGRAEGTFRTDLPVAWLVRTYFALVHAADEHARAQRLKREDALAMLTTTLRDVFTAR